MDGSDSLKMT